MFGGMSLTKEEHKYKSFNSGTHAIKSMQETYAKMFHTVVTTEQIRVKWNIARTSYPSSHAIYEAIKSVYW